MAVATRDTVIGDTVYMVTQLTGMKGNRLAMKLAGIFGGTFLRGEGQGITALASIFDKLTPDEYENLLREVLATCQFKRPNPDGTEGKFQPLMPQFDLAMQGRVVDTAKLLYFALEVNFEDFFAGPVGQFLKGLGGGSLLKASSIIATPGNVGG